MPKNLHIIIHIIYFINTLYYNERIIFIFWKYYQRISFQDREYSINFMEKWGVIELQTSEVFIIFFQVIIIKKNFFLFTPLQWKGQGIISGPPGTYLSIILNLYLTLLCSQALDSWTGVIRAHVVFPDSEEMLPPFTKIFFKSQTDVEFYHKCPPPSRPTLEKFIFLLMWFTTLMDIPILSIYSDAFSNLFLR